ncbi:MAG: RNase adapter RapZ [Polyangiaceae bacterium]
MSPPLRDPQESTPPASLPAIPSGAAAHGSPRGCVVVVTGLSGAGKSTALHALEDLGYYCVDNLPTPVAKETVEVCERGGIRRVGLGIDVRVGSFLDGATSALAQIANGDREVIVLFLDASDEVLLRRFGETRRPHPLSTRTPAGSPATSAVLEGIHQERDQLAPLRAAAAIELDTSQMSVHELRRRVIAHLGPGRAEQPRMETRIVTFGYKYGLPVDASLVLDVRFLDNPYFVPHLRALAGTDEAVQRFIADNPDARTFVDKVEDLLAFLLPKYEAEGKSYLTIAVGCTGGRHRSVALAIDIAERVEKKTGLPITVVHRDVARTDMMKPVARTTAGT